MPRAAAGASYGPPNWPFFSPTRIVQPSPRSKRQPTTSAPPARGRPSSRAARRSAEAESAAGNDDVRMRLEHDEGVRAATSRHGLAPLDTPARRVELQV